MITYKTGPSFSGTSGVGETIKREFHFDFDSVNCHYLGNDAIVSIQDFLKKPSKKGSRVRILTKLNALKDGLNEIFSNPVDPIEYLLYLYYKEELTTHEILERCQKLGLTYQTQGGFHKLLTNSLGWELRDNKEMTERKKRKLSRASSPSLIGLTKSREKLWHDNSKRFHDSLLSILDIPHAGKLYFSEEIFNDINKKSDKVFYLLEIFEGISFEVLSNIVDQTNMGGASLARIINQKLENISKNSNGRIPLLSISQGMIHVLLKKAGVKQ